MMPSENERTVEANMESNNFLPSIFKSSTSSDSDTEGASLSVSPSNRRSSRGSCLTSSSSPTKLPTISRNSSTSMSSMSNSVSSTSSVNSGHKQRQSRLCRSPSCPQLSKLRTGDSPEFMTSQELSKLAFNNLSKSNEIQYGTRFPDIKNKKEGKQARFMAMKREQWLEKQNRKKITGATQTTGTCDLMISPRSQVQNPILLPLGTLSNKENESKKSRKKKVKAHKLEKTENKINVENKTNIDSNQSTEESKNPAESEN